MAPETLGIQGFLRSIKRSDLTHIFTAGCIRSVVTLWSQNELRLAAPAAMLDGPGSEGSPIGRGAVQPGLFRLSRLEAPYSSFAPSAPIPIGPEPAALSYDPSSVIREGERAVR
jgi:hypothetical protein